MGGPTQIPRQQLCIGLLHVLGWMTAQARKREAAEPHLPQPCEGANVLGMLVDQQRGTNAQVSGRHVCGCHVGKFWTSAAWRSTVAQQGFRSPGYEVEAKAYSCVACQGGHAALLFKQSNRSTCGLSRPDPDHQSLMPSAPCALRARPLRDQNFHHVMHSRTQVGAHMLANAAAMSASLPRPLSVP